VFVVEDLLTGTGTFGPASSKPLRHSTNTEMHDNACPVVKLVALLAEVSDLETQHVTLRSKPFKKSTNDTVRHD
jgi:hypothetical protein